MPVLRMEEFMLSHSEQIDQIASALADAQADLGHVIKQSRNEAFGSKYADLSKVWEAFQRVGPRHGLSVVQMPGPYDASSRTMSMSVRLMHNSGQWLGGQMSLPLSRSDAHAYGSACTYARRYSLAAMIGICPHDDDGNEASGVEAIGSARRVGWQPEHRVQRTPHRHSGDAFQAPSLESAAPGQSSDGGRSFPADPQGLQSLRDLVATAAVDETALCQHYKVAALDELSPRDAARVRRALSRKIDNKSAEARR